MEPRKTCLQHQKVLVHLEHVGLPLSLWRWPTRKKCQKSWRNESGHIFDLGATRQRGCFGTLFVRVKAILLFAVDLQRFFSHQRVLVKPLTCQKRRRSNVSVVCVKEWWSTFRPSGPRKKSFVGLLWTSEWQHSHINKLALHYICVVWWTVRVMTNNSSIKFGDDGTNRQDSKEPLRSEELQEQTLVGRRPRFCVVPCILRNTLLPNQRLKICFSNQWYCNVPRLPSKCAGFQFYGLFIVL